MPHGLNSGTFTWERDGVCDGIVRLDSWWHGPVLFPQRSLPLAGRCAAFDYKYHDISSHRGNLHRFSCRVPRGVLEEGQGKDRVGEPTS